MITELQIQNFKAFGSTQRVPLKPITLLFGPNSSGKSSIIHALALSYEMQARGTVDVGEVAFQGGRINLGGFKRW